MFFHAIPHGSSLLWCAMMVVDGNKANYFYEKSVIINEAIQGDSNCCFVLTSEQINFFHFFQARKALNRKTLKLLCPIRCYPHSPSRWAPVSG